MNACDCDCVQVSDINQCSETIQIDLGILNAEKELEVYVSGRSKRIYKLNLVSDLDGVITINTSLLPNGYFSIHTPGKYKISIEENGSPIEITNTGKSCIEFKVNSILEIINP